MPDTKPKTEPKMQPDAPTPEALKKLGAAYAAAMVAGFRADDAGEEIPEDEEVQ